MDQEEQEKRSIGNTLKEMGEEKKAPQEPSQPAQSSGEATAMPVPAHGNQASKKRRTSPKEDASSAVSQSGTNIGRSRVKNSLIVSIGESNINVEDSEIDNCVIFAVDAGGWGINLFAASTDGTGWMRKVGAAERETLSHTLCDDTKDIVTDILKKTQKVGGSLLRRGRPTLDIGGLHRDQNAQNKIDLFALTYQLYMQLLTIEFYRRDSFIGGNFQRTFERKYGELCLADKTLLDLCQNDSNTLTAIKWHLKRDMPLAGTPVFALSAPSKKGDEESVDLKVARRLKEALDQKGICCFWWENFNSLPDVRVKSASKWDRSRRDMRYAPKLGFGFAYSSVMIGIALAREGDSLLFETSDNCKGELALYKKLLDNRKEHVEKPAEMPMTKIEDLPFSQYYVTCVPRDDKSGDGGAIEWAEQKGTSKQDKKKKKKLTEQLKAALPTSRQQFFLCPCDYNGLPDGEIKRTFAGNDRGVVDCGEAGDDEETYVTKCVKTALGRIYEYITRDDVKQERWYKRWLKWAAAHGSGEGTEALKVWFTSVEQNVSAEGIYHESEITPSDYFFEYAVIDEDGYDASAVAKREKSGFKFFLEMDYRNGDPYYRICMVVKDWNEACIRYEPLSSYARRVDGHIPSEEAVSEIRNLCRDSGFPLAQYPFFTVYWNTDEGGNKIPVSENANQKGTVSVSYDQIEYANSGGKIYLSGKDSDDRGAFGKIVFGYSNGNGGIDEARDTKTFRFAVNFAPKYVIRYKVKRHGKGKIRVRLLDHLPPSEMPPTVTLYDLEASGRSRVGDPVRLAKKMDFDASESKRGTYRLRIEEKSGRLYILRNVKGLKTKERDRMFKNGQFLTCPYCAGIVFNLKRHRFFLGRKLICCDGLTFEEEIAALQREQDEIKHAMDDDESIKMLEDPEKNARITELNNKKEELDQTIASLEKELKAAKFSHPGQLYCAKAERWLPKGYQNSNGLTLAFAGDIGTGKSSIISASFAVKRGSIAKNRSFTPILSEDMTQNEDRIALVDAQGHDTSSKYGADIVTFGLDNQDTADSGSILANALSPLGEIKRYKGIHVPKVYFMYTKELYREFVAGTENLPVVVKELRKTPIVMNLTSEGGKKNGYFSCFDAPGGKFSEDLKGDNSAVGHNEGDLTDTAAEFASSLILILAPKQLNKMNTIIGSLIRARINAINKLPETVEKMKKQKAVEQQPEEKEKGEKAQKQKKKAVKEPKESKQEQMLREFNLAIVLNKCDEIWDKFDEGGYVRSTPPGFVDHYHGSREEAYVDQCSEEVELYLKKRAEHPIDVLATLSEWDRKVKEPDDRSRAAEEAQTEKFHFHCKFFAVSSIGHPKAVSVQTEKGQNNQEKTRSTTVFITRPRGLEHVYAWLAYQSGLIH